MTSSVYGDEVIDGGTHEIVGGSAATQGTNWNVSGDLSVGDGGQGTLAIQDGGIVDVPDRTLLGIQAGGVGTVTVTGEGSNLTGTTLFVGDDGQGTLTIRDGGIAAFTGIAEIGQDVTGVGSVTVSGEGASFAASVHIFVGDFGTGTLLIEDGAAVTAPNSAIGYRETGQGNVTVTGEGSSWALSGQQRVGRAGVGTLSVEDGATVTIGTNSIIGLHSTGQGSITVSGEGSNYAVSSTLDVGYAGQGTVIIRDGAEVTIGTDTTIGYQNSGSGVVTVSGEGSSYGVSGTMVLADYGAGSLTVQDGGAVTLTGSTKMIVVGQSTGSTGTLTIGAAAGDAAVSAGMIDADTIAFGSGTGTLVFNHTSDDFVLASDLTGVGSVEVLSGRTHLTGDSSSFFGTTTIDGGHLAIRGSLSGDLSFSTGSLDVEAGGVVASSGDTVVGAASAASGSVKVAGVGATWTTSGELVLGDEGTGVLSVQDGGAVALTGSTRTITLAQGAGSVGTINVGAAAGDAAVSAGMIDADTIAFGSGTGRLVFNHTSDDFVLASDLTGVGSVEVLSGRTDLTGDSSSFSGTTTIDNSQLAVNGILGGTVTVNTDGTLSGAGSLTGATTVNGGGTVSPGNSIGTITVSDITFDAGSTY
ncbi:MAG: hypothetical protein K5905_29200, partial [Roseibium sp.]|nr:hypothetical protein [Roseibium sp.]